MPRLQREERMLIEILPLVSSTPTTQRLRSARRLARRLTLLTEHALYHAHCARWRRLHSPAALPRHAAAASIALVGAPSMLRGARMAGGRRRAHYRACSRTRAACCMPVGFTPNTPPACYCACWDIVRGRWLPARWPWIPPCRKEEMPPTTFYLVDSLPPVPCDMQLPIIP